MSNARNSWQAMLVRCLNPKSDKYHRYGGRGIKVCRRWRASFPNFLKDMGPRPDGTTLDRIDNNKGYSKRNCRWATKAVQSRNTSTNRFISHGGKTLCLVDWGRESGLGFKNIDNRLRRGWSVGDALTIPIGGSNGSLRVLTLNGETLPIGKWAKRLGFKSKNSIYMRLRAGWSVKLALSIPPADPRLITFRGKAQTHGAWAKELGIDRSVIKARIAMGWDAERALTQPVRHW